MAFILVVEDDPILLGLVSSLLRRDGHEVQEAISSTSALQILEKEKHRCELVLTDFEMKPTNGLQLVHRIVQKSPGMKILFMSGYPTVSHAIEEEFGPDCLLVKPFSAQDLARKIKRVLGHKVRRNSQNVAGLM